MLNIPKWKIVISLILMVLGIVYALPNLASEDTRNRLAQNLPAWMPHRAVSLGLDLQGGSHLLLQVDLATVLRERMESMTDAARSELRRANIQYTSMTTLRDGIALTLRNPETDRTAAYRVLRGLENNLNIDVGAAGRVTVRLTDQAFSEIQAQVVSQSIEIVRRRVDESGTREPVIQRQGADRIVLQLPGVDDPARIKDLLGQTAKMTFHLVDLEAVRPGPASMSLPMRETGAPIIVRKRALITGDMLVDSQPSFDRNSPVVTFRFNAMGARRFCEVTRANVGKPFAIVLDDEVISAPVIRDAICGGSGQIEGGFTVKEAADLSLLLRAGALPAPLEVIEERSVGPSLGSDSVEAGKKAALVAFAAVVLFMLISYGLFGVFATVALALNVFFIFAIMSVLQATLTLPGVAGVVLTIGMAVDANVLIFERIREELRQGRSLISAIDKGFEKAFGTILDSNLTSLIVALILFSFGSGPVKGFAVSMTIGIITSMFTAIMLTRLMVVAWLRGTRASSINI